MATLAQNLSALLDYPGSYSRHAQHLPLLVISDSAYREAMERERLLELAELRGKAARLRQQLAAIEAQVETLEAAGKPDT